MSPATNYRSLFLDCDDPEPDVVVWKAMRVNATREDRGSIVLYVPFARCETTNGYSGSDAERINHEVRIRAYAGGIIRVTFSLTNAEPDELNPMLAFADDLRPVELRLKTTTETWRIVDPNGRRLIEIDRSAPETVDWSSLIVSPDLHFNCHLYPGIGDNEVQYADQDTFTPRLLNSLPLAYAETPKGIITLGSIHADANEHFVGTGERFAKLDLSGRTIELENRDALGVNNQDAYKNVPFYLSSSGYGLFLNTSNRVLLSLADVSTRAVAYRNEGPTLDQFFFGGQPAAILRDYRRVTGFPPILPTWSYGVWMSRMTYFSAEEINEIANRMRKESYPCDVIHIDTGWFRENWVCEWEFSPERFPQPAAFMSGLREKGFRVSLWQTPEITEGSKPYDESVQRGYVANFANRKTESNFAVAQSEKRSIDFTNPKAVEWYKGMLQRLHELGASVIKTDFGETITTNAEYHSLEAQTLRNRYALLYQKAAFEAAAKSNEAPLIWARAGWAGCQRYPVHWAGDCSADWDGLAATLRGGLHLGLSGFAYWSHDVSGFHGLPDFMNTRPTDELYLRWTQFGVFTSHMRYHGTSVREPWEYPTVSDEVRRWLQLRYSLIPYLLREQETLVSTGSPIIRALPFDFPDDPIAWTVDDQYCFGSDFLVAPMVQSGATRRVYIPEGEWIDFWSGERLIGCSFRVAESISQNLMPILVRKGANLPLHAAIIQHTQELDTTNNLEIPIDDSYSGFYQTPVGQALSWPRDSIAWSPVSSRK